MDAKAEVLLKQLLQTPSPSGFEQPVQQIVRQYMQDIAESVTTDVHGNVISSINPAAEIRVVLDGHCDQIGMLVSHIDDQGFVYAQPIGGWDPQQLVGQRMCIWGREGLVNAVISRKPIHLLNDSERKQVVKLQDLWLDIGAKDKSEATERVRVGDPVTLELGMHKLLGSRATAPGMDNKTGLWVVIEAFRRAVQHSRELQCALYCVSAVQEEIGLRGTKTSSYAIDPHVGLAVDVTHATDCPSIDQRQLGDVALGNGPVIFLGPNINPVVSQRLIASAAANDYSYQLVAIGRATPNDANSLQINRSGVATGLVSIPNRYMHSAVETIDLKDLDTAADLLADFVLSIQVDDTFIPQ